MLLNGLQLLLALHTEKIKKEHESFRLRTSKSWAAAAAAESITINRKSCLSRSSTIGTKRIHSHQHAFIGAIILSAHVNVNEKKNRMHHHRLPIDDLLWWLKPIHFLGCACIFAFFELLSLKWSSFMVVQRGNLNFMQKRIERDTQASVD